MRKLGYVIAALGAITIAVPSIASAETVVIKRDHGWHHGWHRDWHRAYGFDRDRDFHRHDRVVIRHRDIY